MSSALVTNTMNPCTWLRSSDGRFGGRGASRAKRGPYSMRRPRMVTHGNPTIRDGCGIGQSSGWVEALGPGSPELDRPVVMVLDCNALLGAS